MPRARIPINEMTAAEVEQKRDELRKELFNLRFRNAMRQLDNPVQIRYLKRDIARLATALTEHGSGMRRLAGDED
jgi:large subunit ribosomal protein L29